jgi:hypothetical protein
MGFMMTYDKERWRCLIGMAEAEEPVVFIYSDTRNSVGMEDQRVAVDTSVKQKLFGIMIIHSLRMRCYADIFISHDAG